MLKFLFDLLVEVFEKLGAGFEASAKYENDFALALLSGDD